MNVPQLLKRFLSGRIGPELAAEIMRLRSQFGALKAQSRFEELAAHRKYIHDVLSQADFSIQNEDLVCVECYFGLNGHRVHSMSAIAKHLGKKSERGIIYRIRKVLVDRLGKTKAKRLLAVRDRLAYYLTRAIKAQAVRLQLAVARRINALLNIPASPKTKIEKIEGRRVVTIHFTAWKSWGDEGLEEWVPCIDKYGEIAEDAISKAQALTRDLRLAATAEDAKKLFIIPDSNSFEHVVSLTPKVLHEYIYTSQPGKQGILERYELEDLSGFEFHHIRQTNLTHMVINGATIHDSADYLGHRRSRGGADIAATFYLAGGTAEGRARAAEAIYRGAATGRQFDAIARVEIEAMGEDAKRAPVPPNQLSYEEALDRINKEDIVDGHCFKPINVTQLFRRKIIVNVTRYRGCLLPATSGPCPTSERCPTGVDFDRADSPGCGCKYQVIMPHAEEQLIKDIEIMKAQLEEMKGDEFEAWREHIHAKLNRWRLHLGIVRSLKASMEDE